MEFSMFLVIFVAVYHVVDAQCDYSSLGADHTMCKYSGIGKECENVTRRGFTDCEKFEMVKAHNEMRIKVAAAHARGQPMASNMKEVRWDDELATIAQRWADQCIIGHDTNRKTKKFGGVGQNGYSSGGVGYVLTRTAVTAWYDEVTKFNSSHIKPFKYIYEAGHYSQLAWANTEAIGCGVVFFSLARNQGFYVNQWIVCNYGPGGNMRGASMYETGVPPCSECTNGCSQCTNGCSTTYTGLCK